MKAEESKKVKRENQVEIRHLCGICNRAFCRVCSLQRHIKCRHRFSFETQADNIVKSFAVNKIGDVIEIYSDDDSVDDSGDSDDSGDGAREKIVVPQGSHSDEKCSPEFGKRTCENNTEEPNCEMNTRTAESNNCIRKSIRIKNKACCNCTMRGQTTLQNVKSEVNTRKSQRIKTRAHGSCTTCERKQAVLQNASSEEGTGKSQRIKTRALGKSTMTLCEMKHFPLRNATSEENTRKSQRIKRRARYICTTFKKKRTTLRTIKSEQNTRKSQRIKSIFNNNCSTIESKRIETTPRKAQAAKRTIAIVRMKDENEKCTKTCETKPNSLVNGQTEKTEVVGTDRDKREATTMECGNGGSHTAANDLEIENVNGRCPIVSDDLIPRDIQCKTVSEGVDKWGSRNSGSNLAIGNYTNRFSLVSELAIENNDGYPVDDENARSHDLTSAGLDIRYPLLHTYDKRCDLGTFYMRNEQNKDGRSHGLMSETSGEDLKFHYIKEEARPLSLIKNGNCSGMQSEILGYKLERGAALGDSIETPLVSVDKMFNSSGELFSYSGNEELTESNGPKSENLGLVFENRNGYPVVARVLSNHQQYGIFEISSIDEHSSDGSTLARDNSNTHENICDSFSPTIIEQRTYQTYDLEPGCLGDSTQSSFQTSLGEMKIEPETNFPDYPVSVVEEYDPLCDVIDFPYVEDMDCSLAVGEDEEIFQYDPDILQHRVKPK